MISRFLLFTSPSRRLSPTPSPALHAFAAGASSSAPPVPVAQAPSPGADDPDGSCDDEGNEENEDNNQDNNGNNNMSQTRMEDLTECDLSLSITPRYSRWVTSKIYCRMCYMSWESTFVLFITHNGFLRPLGLAIISPVCISE
jgi:hypothetical protein